MCRIFCRKLANPLLAEKQQPDNLPVQVPVGMRGCQDLKPNKQSSKGTLLVPALLVGTKSLITPPGDKAIYLSGSTHEPQPTRSEAGT